MFLNTNNANHLHLCSLDNLSFFFSSRKNNVWQCKRLCRAYDEKCSNILIFNINTWMISIKFQTCIFVHNFCLFVTHVLSVSIRFVWMNKLNINIWWFYFIIIKFFAFLTISLLISLKEENKNTENSMPLKKI